LFGNPEKLWPKISPDGKLLAYLSPHDGVLNVWVRTLGKEDDRVITTSKEHSITIYFWQYDSKHILYLKDLHGNGTFHLFQTNIETKLTRDLTPFEDVSATGFYRGEHMFGDPNFPDELLVGLDIRDRKLHDWYRINLKNGAVELDTKNPGDVWIWRADNNFQVRTAQAQAPDGGFEIRIRNDSKSPWRTFQKWGPDETTNSYVAGFTPDNRAIYLISSVDANAARLLKVDIQTGNTQVIAEDPQYDVTRIMRHPKNHELEAVLFSRARSEWQVISESVQRDFEIIEKVRDGSFYITSRDLADKIWIVKYGMDDGPVYYYVYNRESKKATLLFSDRPQLEKYNLVRKQPISYRARDGMKIFGYLTIPMGVEPKNLPMIVLVHGGPWSRYGGGFDNEVQWLANRGYAVFQINFRGSSGYGKDYLNAGDREYGGKMLTDLIDGKEWAIRKGYADSSRIGIMGFSYGGYATLSILAFMPDEFACGVNQFGDCNLVELLQQLKNPISGPWIAKRIGDEEEFLKSISPFYKAHQIKKPLLIVQGAYENEMKLKEIEEMVKVMRNNNRAVDYILFPDEGHGLAKPKNRLKLYAFLEAFFAKYLGGRAEPPSEEEKIVNFRK